MKISQSAHRILFITGGREREREREGEKLYLSAADNDLAD